MTDSEAESIGEGIAGSILDLHELLNEAAGGNWPRPIPVTERLPEKNKAVLWYHTWDRCTYWAYGYLVVDGAHSGVHIRGNQREYEAIDHFSHWLPLPPKPE